jgi:outer membrane immunogenic protein
MMRRVLATVGLAVLTVGSAHGSDMPGRYLPPPRAPTYVPFFTWNGFYVGFNAGYGFGQSNWNDTVTSLSTGNFDVSGALLGGTIGYNYQLGGVVLGLEGDLGWAAIKGSTTTNCPTTCQTQADWLGTGRVRIGYAFDRFLPYFTGGAAFGSLKGTTTGFGSFTTTQVGWTFGGGVEYAFVDHWSVKAEYLYVDLGKATCNSSCSGTDPFDVTFKTSIIRGGVNYKF